MLLLLLMYLSPVVAAVLFWRSQSVVAGIGPDGDGDGDDEHNLCSAAAAVAVAAILPALAGIGMGMGAAIGVALGFTAWAAASAPLAPDEESASEACPRLRRSALLAWARTMALSAVVGATLVN